MKKLTLEGKLLIQCEDILRQLSALYSRKICYTCTVLQTILQWPKVLHSDGHFLKQLIKLRGPNSTLSYACTTQSKWKLCAHSQRQNLAQNILKG